MREKKAVFSIRIAPSMRETIERWADMLGMSSGEFIRVAAIEYAKKQGLYRSGEIVEKYDIRHTE